MKKFALGFAILMLSGCSTQEDLIATPALDSNNTVQAQSGTKNGLFEKLSFSLASFRTNTSGTYVEGIAATINPLIGKTQTEVRFKFVDQRNSGDSDVMHGFLLSSKDGDIYFVPSKYTKYDPVSPTLDKEFIDGQTYSCYKIAERFLPTKENDFQIARLIPAYGLRLIKSETRKDYVLNETNKEMEIYQKSGTLFIRSERKISDFKLESRT